MIHIGHIFGVDIYIDPFILPAFILMSYSGTIELMPFCLAAFAVHEAGHLFSAYSHGIRIDRIILGPFGGTIVADSSFCSIRQLIMLYSSGVLANITAFAFFFTIGAYMKNPYMLITGEINIVLAIINLLPAYPWDGSKILQCAISAKLRIRNAIVTIKIVSFLIGVLLLAAGIVYYVQYKDFPAFILLVCAVTAYSALIQKSTGEYGSAISRLRKIRSTAITGYKIVTVAVEHTTTVKKALQFGREGVMTVFCVYESLPHGKRSMLGELNEQEILDYYVATGANSLLTRVLDEKNMKIQHDDH